VTKAHFVLLAALLAAGCATPVPAAPTPSAAVTPAALPTPTSAAASAGAEAARPAVAAPTAAATLAPTIPEGLSPPDRAAFAEARLLLVEGDYTGAAERWRHLLAVPAAAASVVVVIAITRSRAGEPALLVARAGIAAIVIVVAIARTSAAALFPASTRGFRVALGVAVPAAVPAAVAPYAERDDRRVLEEKKEIGNMTGAPLFDQRLLHLERLAVGNHAETVDFVEGKLFSFRTTGIDSTFKYEVEPRAGGSHLVATVSYEVPAGVLAKVADRAVVARMNEREADQAIKNIQAIFSS